MAKPYVISNGSSLLNSYQLKDWEMGALLGSGGFSSVYAMRDRRLSEPPLLKDSAHQKKQQKAAVAAIQRLSLFPLIDPALAPEVTNTSDHSSSSLSKSLKQPRDDNIKCNATSSITSSTSDSSSRSPTRRDVQVSREFRNLGDSESSEPEESTELAMKTLHRKTLSNEKKARRAAKDLEMEVSILSKLPRHANIIKLYGVSSDFYTEYSATAFIVLEKLNESLDKTILRWRKEAGQSEGSNGNVLARIMSRKRKSQTHLTRQSQTDRIRQVAIAITCAMKHCHSNRVIYRDLKPANIGFAQDGTPRLFDFACAKILKEPNTTLHHRCGTLRYMAPEVVRREHYSFPVDIYSFGMVFWEILMLEKPYAGITDKAELSAKVMQPNKHPNLKHIASPFVQYILANCWGEKPEDRPSFEMLHDWLSSEVERQVDSTTTSTEEEA